MLRTLYMYSSQQRQALSQLLGFVSVFSVMINPVHAAVDDDFARLFLSPEQNIEVMTNETFTLHLMAESSRPANAFAAVLAYDPRVLSVVNTDMAQSQVNIWVQKPEVDTSLGEIEFIGGTAGRDGLTEVGALFSITFKALQPETTTLSLKDTEIRLSDGNGTAANALLVDDVVVEVSEEKSGYTGSPHTISTDDTDINRDGKTTFNDVGAYLEYLRIGDDRADLNDDGRIDMLDWELLTGALGNASPAHTNPRSDIFLTLLSFAALSVLGLLIVTCRIILLR